MNLAACGGLPLTPETGTWYRAVQLAYLATALSSAHTSSSRTRFNPGALLPAAQRFQILYFAEDPVTATFEFGAMLGSPFRPGGAVAHPQRPYAMLNIQVILSQAADLSDVAAQNLLATTVQELTGDWDGYQVRGPATSVSAPTGQAPTQRLGHALFNTNCEGFRSVSAKVPCNRTLMVFPQRLFPGSSLVFRDPSGSVVYRVP